MSYYIYNTILLYIIVIFTTKRFLVPGQQVHFPTSRRLVRVVSHIAAFGFVLAREAFALQKLLVRLARYGRKSAAWRNAVREKFIRPPVIAQTPAVHFRRS